MRSAIIILVAAMLVLSAADVRAAVDQGMVLQGRPVAGSPAPVSGSVLAFNGTSWVAGPVQWSGDVNDTTQKFVSNSGSTGTQSTGFGAVWVKDDQGLLLTNLADTQRVTFTASGANTVTIDGGVTLPSGKTLTLGGLLTQSVGSTTGTPIDSDATLTGSGGSIGASFSYVDSDPSAAGNASYGVWSNYTASSTHSNDQIIAVRGDTTATHHGTTLNIGSVSQPLVAMGMYGSVSVSAAAGTGIGGYFFSDRTSVVGDNIGIFAEAGSANSVNAVAVLGMSRLGTNRVAGWFSTANTTPTFASVATHIDNGTNAQPILDIADDTAVILRVLDNGGLQNPNSSGSAVGQFGAVAVLDDDGVVIANAADTQRVTHTATGASEETIAGAVIQRDDGGQRWRNTAGTEGARRLVFRQTTTNTAAATEVTIDGAGTIFLPALADGDTVGYVIYVTGRGTAGTNDNASAFYKMEAAIQRTGASTTLLNSNLTNYYDDINPWTIQVSADDVNERLRLQVVGDAGTTINWRGYADITTVN